MQLNNSKKGNLGLIAIIGLVVVVIIVLFATGTLGGTDIDSLTPKKSGCDDTMGVRISGQINVEDASWIGIDPEPTKIRVSEVRSYGLSIFDEDYTWRVCLINTRTNNEAGCDSGKDSLSGSVDVATQDFVIDFTMPDNDCNGVIDDFDGKLVATVTQDGEDVLITDTISFRDGRWEQKD